MAFSNVWHNPVAQIVRIFLKTLGVIVVFRGVGSHLKLNITSDLSLASIKRLPALDMTSFEPRLMMSSAIIRHPRSVGAPQAVPPPNGDPELLRALDYSPHRVSEHR
jgi:hypothetical protein